MKVLYVNSLYPPHIGGGAEIALAAMVQGFRQRGQQASVLTTHGGSGVVRDEVQGAPVVRLGHKNLYWQFPPQDRPAWARTVWHALDSYNLPMARQAGAVIDELAPELIVCHNLAGLSVAVWAQAAQRGIPIVQVLHDYYSLCPKVTMFKRGGPCAGPCGGCRAFRWPHRLASKAVSAVVGVSRAVLDTHLAQGMFSRARVRAVVHNARSLPPPARERGATAVPGVFTFGFIGGLTEIKGVDLLARAFAQMARRSDRPVRLLIAGTGKDEHVAELQREHAGDKVHFVGHVNPLEFFDQVDVCVVPSLWNEPLGMVAFEAVASGVPVIGACRGGIPEMVRHELNGLLFEPDEAGALEHAMQRLMDSPELLQSMRQAGRASVAQFLDPARMLDEYEAIYGQLVHGATPSMSVAADRSAVYAATMPSTAQPVDERASIGKTANEPAVPPLGLGGH